MQTTQYYPQEPSQQGGRRDADFEQLFRSQMRSLEHFVAARVRHPQDAQDIAAEALTETLEYCRKFERPTSDPRMLRALLFKIARRRMADYYERWKREQRVKPLEEAPPIAAPGSIPVMIDTRNELGTTRAVLMTIREEYREVITLHAIVGLSIREIAELMEKPEVNVRVLLFRARRSLRKALRTQRPDVYGSEAVDQSGDQ